MASDFRSRSAPGIIFASMGTLILLAGAVLLLASCSSPGPRDSESDPLEISIESGSDAREDDPKVAQADAPKCERGEFGIPSTPESERARPGPQARGISLAG